ncbi:hypothetical protein PY650_15185 [Rhizobium calliandrae]|uniref:Spermidine synthase n=1 Tax=Rhizobium calliandrae TaxID=1312182 RepID=A0ABT7KG67_9HYPH|nr:hypothetical protein [Rhizobium calliandrae]MDL2406983.1 hypothetical protein [Rhizobium calliandrae]
MIAQIVPFNAIFIVSDPTQKWRLAANFLLYLLPFLSGAFFLGLIFLKGHSWFSRFYFADLCGSGVAGLLILGALYFVPPEKIIVVPLILWAVSLFSWFAANSLLRSRRRNLIGAASLAVLSLASYLGLAGLFDVEPIQITQFKGISYARNYPDSKRVYRSVSPFGDLQLYQSSYMHFAPGLSDNAAFNVPEVPPNTYAGLYIDGDGPEGVMRDLPPEDGSYYHYLPDYYPYVLKERPATFIVELGGGISTMVALHAGSLSVTASERNPAVLAALRDPGLYPITSGFLSNSNVTAVAGDGRLYLENTAKRYDIIDLSLADSVGLSSPGGFTIVERYDFSKEAMGDYMRALRDGGILSVTAWNKEEPPKAVLKLYATIAGAAEEIEPATFARSFFVASSYLSTTTILYKRGGFTSQEIEKLRQYTRSMSFDEIYSPGFGYEMSGGDKILADYRASVFGDAPLEVSTTDATLSDGDGPPADNSEMPATSLERLVWQSLISGRWADIAHRYVFDIQPLTDDRPYFAGYEKLQDLPKALARLALFQDDWGYLVLWATLGVASAATLPLILIPLFVGWRRSFARTPGKAGTILYFACLGVGFIMVEVGLISRFTLVLGSATISASVLIAGMLVFSGLGSLLSERFVERARIALPVILAAIAGLLAVYAVGLTPLFGFIGGYRYTIRLVICFFAIAPAAILMGFPMATAMSWLARLGKDHMFVWAWGINGCFSVIGAALVPIIATTFGIHTVLGVSAAAYAIAIPAFFAVLRPTAASADDRVSNR